MADLALLTADRLRVVEAFEQMTAPMAETLAIGDVVRFDTANGKFTGSNATSAAEARCYGIITSIGPAGATALRKGVIDGFDIAALAYDADVYLSITDKKLATTAPVVAGQIPVRVATVIGGFMTTLGTAADKLLRIDFGYKPDPAVT